MNNDTRTEHVTRENILMLLSDDEVASVSTAETKARPRIGEEYLLRVRRWPVRENNG